jgi:hypothetical protein
VKPAFCIEAKNETQYFSRPRKSSCSMQAVAHKFKGINLQVCEPMPLSMLSEAWVCGRLIVLGSRVRIPLWAWIFVVFVVLCVGCGFCDELITHSEKPC